MNALLDKIFYGEIVLPDDIHVAAGRQCNLWWSTVANFEEGDRSVYFEVKCDVGMTTARGFTLDATREMIGDHAFTVRSRSLYTREILSEKKATIHVVDPDAGEGERNILFIGDSRSWHTVSGAQGYSNIESGDKTTTTEIKSLLNNTNGARFHFLGTKVSPKDPDVRNLADNGWQYATAVCELENAGGVRAYIEKECGAGEGAKLDYVSVMYGNNDLMDWHVNNLDQYELSVAKIEKIIANARKLFDMILADYPECKIILVLEPSTAGNQDGYGFWYGTRNDCQQEVEFACKALRKATLAEFDGHRYSDNLYISTAGLWCDRIYGFPYLTMPPSVRSTESRIDRLINCVHPHDCGYKQIADGDFSSIKYLESLK